MKVVKKIKIEMTKKEKSSLRKKLVAAEKLLNGGKNWITGSEGDGEGNYCLIGALRHVRAGDGAETLVAYAIDAERLADNDDPYDIITDFNDAQEDGLREYKNIAKAFRDAQKLTK